MQKTFRKLREGFTLIELLIVIVIIGVLATAVLSAINPIEQIKKARDAGRRSDSAELLNALERYYTAYEEYPWDVMSISTIPEPGVSGQNVSSGMDNWLGSADNSLTSTGELKGEFTARDNLTDMYVWHDTGSDLVRICFAPESQQNTSLATYSSLGTAGGTGGWMCVPE